MKALKKILVNKGISPSMHRIKILEYLSKNRIHPTADDIFRALEQEIPTLSKTTVYNTLRIFISKGILTALSVFENEVRYEYEMEPHIHFKCIRCGQIYDVNKEYECLQDKNIAGHKVIEHHVNLKGVCKKCLAKEEK